MGAKRMETMDPPAEMRALAQRACTPVGLGRGSTKIRTRESSLVRIYTPFGTIGN